ncbi:MAG: hypothetical protein BGO98_06765 [Myxococcales bacterium 68-20]|nr:MAG: hypothetical protein BGO98_06765 [Myxococcales bacterium 68-20]
MRAAPALVVALLIALCGLVRTPSARADEVAPDLEGSDLRVKAQAELKRLLSAMPSNDQRRLVGVYMAFDTSTSDPLAQVACDDDGDYVVLVSDAMLRLLGHIARAESYDEANASSKVEEYAAFLVRSQTPGRRLLPPSPGFYIATKPASTYEDRLADALSFVVAHELTRLRAGDLVCSKPTATKESGDDVWTSAEQRKAAESAEHVYPARQMGRDEEAIDRVLESGRSVRGALAVLRFFTQFEIESRIALGRFSPPYLVHHPSASLRLANLKRAIEARRSESD